MSLIDGFKEGLVVFQDKANVFFIFIWAKLKDYKNLSLGEQISYPSIGLGLIMILISAGVFIL